MDSFAQSIKDAVSALPVKNKCCRDAWLYGMLWFADMRSSTLVSIVSENESVLSCCERLLLESVGGVCDIEYFGSGCRLTITDSYTLDGVFALFGDFSSVEERLFHCEACHRHFLRGAFMSAGTVNSPESNYHLELDTVYPCECTIPIFNLVGLFPRVAKRAGTNVIYLKNSEDIGDFLNCIGARNAAFSLINEKIRRELRNNANRQKNFDTANIKKSVEANKIQLFAVRRLIEEKRLGRLPAQLRATALLRYDHPDLPLSELAQLHDPPISKSGLSHRLARIIELATEE